jgi:retinol dehydrogenase-12
MACPYSLTKDGFEMQMGTNHFGHFYLTQLLLPQLLKSKSRVVNVSSTAHALWQVPCTLETYTEQMNKETYKPWNAYAISKIANIYFTIELQRRFGSQGLRAYSLHPGGVATGLQRHISISQLVNVPVRFLIFKTELEGAQTNLFCAVSDEAVPGKFHSDCQESGLGNPHADNPEQAREWWDYSEKIVAEKIKEHHD